MKHYLISFALCFCLAVYSGTAVAAVHQHTGNPGNTDRDITEIKSKKAWEKKKKSILAGMEAVMGPLPSRKSLPDFNMQLLDSTVEPHFTKYHISFNVAKDELLTALLLIPRKAASGGGKLPAMIALHGTDPLGKLAVFGRSRLPNRAYAKELAERGYIVIAPDYPDFGESSPYDFDKDRYISGTMKGIFNHIRCVDLLLSLKVVDPEKIGIIGHSLGGHNAIFAAAFDPRIKVIVSSCGWTPFGFYNAGDEVTAKHGGKLGPWAQARYMPLIRTRYNLDAKKVPFDFDEIIASLAPRAFFSNSPIEDKNFDVNGVKNAVPRIKHIYSLYHAPENIQVRYPDAGHDFPPEVRTESYLLIDAVFGKRNR